MNKMLNPCVCNNFREMSNAAYLTKKGVSGREKRYYRMLNENGDIKTPARSFRRVEEGKGELLRGMHFPYGEAKKV